MIIENERETSLKYVQLAEKYLQPQKKAQSIAVMNVISKEDFTQAKPKWFIGKQKIDSFI